MRQDLHYRKEMNLSISNGVSLGNGPKHSFLILFYILYKVHFLIL